MDKIEVKPDGIVIHYNVGESHYLRELNDHQGASPKLLSKAAISAENGLKQAPETKKGPVDLIRPSSKPFLKYRSENSFVECSNTLTIGRETFPYIYTNDSR